MKIFLGVIIAVVTIILIGIHPTKSVGQTIYTFLIGFILFSAVVQIPDKDNNKNYDKTYYAQSSYYSNSSTRRNALSKEEADSLRGTGYHNTRPGSVAENIELTAAQIKCKECGYHSDNGANSYCDSCQKMIYNK